MVDESPKPGILGLTGFLLGGLILAVTYLFAAAVLGLNGIHESVASPLTAAARDGTTLTFSIIGFFLLTPLLVAGIAALMGRHGAHTGQAAAGAAAVTTLVGVPLLWVNLAIASLVAAAILGAQGLDEIFDHTVEVLLSSAVALIAALGPLVGLAALVANRATAWSTATAEAVGAIPGARTRAPQQMQPTYDEGAWEEPPPEPEPMPEPAPLPEGTPVYAGAHDDNMLHDHPVDCPRCGNTFTVSGERPLRITCPECGKAGTIR